MVRSIRKRDGRLMPFKKSKIKDAIYKAEESVDMVEGENSDLLTAKVLERINKLNMTTPDVESIQDIVEEVLISSGFMKTAKSYIKYRAERSKYREKNTKLMKSFKQIASVDSNESDLKRENANVNGDSAMGAMLKYGSESAKDYNLKFVIPEYISERHRNGDIHIHDLDFYTLTMTCLVKSTKIVLRINGEIQHTTIGELGYFFNDCEEGVVDLKDKDIEILSRDGKFVKLINCSRHKVKRDEDVYSIKTYLGSIECTGEHKIPVIRDGKEILQLAQDIRVGDKFISRDGSFGEENEIESINKIAYMDYVYDIETEDHHFVANNFIVHNCCQIDLEKLFKNGFNTGHGYIREPNKIRSYAALSCIAIQSNQNDMHKQTIN